MNTNTNLPEGDFNPASCKAKSVIRRFYFFLVKWLVLKPLVKLSYIINGKMMGDVKWYQRRFTTPVRWKWLSNVTYRLTKYVMFS